MTFLFGRYWHFALLCKISLKLTVTIIHLTFTLMKRHVLLFALALSVIQGYAQTLQPFSGKVPSPIAVAGEKFSPIEVADATGLTHARPSAPQLRAGETLTLTFALCGDIYGALSLNGQAVGNEIWQAVEIDESNVNELAGNKITAINIANPSSKLKTNIVNDVTVFLTYDLDETPFYTQNAKLTTDPYAYTSISLDTPYTIESGKPVYFGYYFALTKDQISSAYYLVVDYVPTSNLSGSWVKYKYNGVYEWDNLAEVYGSLCITADISGENLPQNSASILQMSCPSTVTTGESFDFDVVMTNNAANNMTSLEVEYKVGDATNTVTFTAGGDGLAYGESAKGTISGAVSANSGINIPVSARITKVNGVDNTKADEEMTTVINSLASGTGFQKNVVIEEGTGTWCQFCPLGIPLMEYAREHYNDGSLIPIGVHDGDPMAIGNYASVLQRYFSGFPQYIANRNLNYATGFYSDFDYNKQVLGTIYDELRATPAVGKIEATAEYTDDSMSSAKITANAEFIMDNTADFRLAFVLLEDNVGPYDQVNSLSGKAQQYTGYERFTSAGNPVSVTFNDVARAIEEPFGIQNSLPGVMEGGKKYSYEHTMSLAHMSHPDNCRVVAMLLNAVTGEIDNAVEVKVTPSAGINGTASDNNAVTVAGAAGAVNIMGTYTTATVYNTDGTVAARANGASVIPLRAGIYIVKADSTVAKVIVR